LVNRLLTGERRSPSQPATPDANALPGQPALRPLAGGILGRHRLIARRPLRERWSRASRSARPTRGQGSQRSPCARVTAFTFCLKSRTAYGANGERTLPHVDTSAALDRADVERATRDATGWNKSLSSWLADQIEVPMDRTMRCSKCGKRMLPVVTISGRTDLQCISCDDPAVKWAESPVTVPEKPIVLDRVTVMKE